MMEAPGVKGHTTKPAQRVTRTVAGVIFIFVVTLIAYLPALPGGFIWDDPEHISENAPVRSPGGLKDIWFKPGATPQYYPLTFTGFWAGYQLWGLNPVGFHLLNVLLHATAATLLWQVAARLRVRGAWLAGAIFALHPVNVMSVAWMTELKNTLAGSLALATTWSYLRFAGLGVYERTGKAAASWGWGLFCLGLFLLAMFAKTAVSFLPASLLLLAWWQSPRMHWRQAWPPLVMLAIVFAMGQLTFHVERLHGASGEIFTLGPVEKILVSGRSFWFYLSKLLLPRELTFIYERWQIDTHAWWQYLFPLATVALLAGLWAARRRIGKGPFVAMLHFYIGTSMLILFIVLYMTQYSFVSDHWQYFGCMSAIPLMAAGIDRGLTWLKARRLFGTPALVGMLLLLLGFLSWRQCGMYRDRETLWQITLERNPKCWLAHNNLGFMRAEANRLDDAITHYQQALTLNPGHVDTRINLAVALFKADRIPDAIVQLQTVLQISPDEADAHNNLGFLLMKAGRMQEALLHMRTAVRLDPEGVTARNNLAWALATGPEASLRNGAEAIELAEQALRLAGVRNAELLETLAAAYAEVGRFSEAEAVATEALQRIQDNPSLKAKIQKELDLYKARLPCCDR